MSISSGSGKVDYALVIAGAPDIWVTSTRLEQTLSDGRVIRAGLQYQGLRIREEVHLKDAELDVSGISFRIVHGQALQAFSLRATELGLLDADWTSGSFFTIRDTEFPDVGSRVHLGTACYEIASRVHPDDGSVVSIAVTTDVEEPIWDTLPQHHYKTIGTEASFPPVHDAPWSFEGRRVYLYRFDATETWNDTSATTPYYATDKTPIWRGVIRQAPRLDGDALTWVVETDSIVELMKQTMAGGVGPAHLRGAWYHKDCPFAIYVQRWSSTDFVTGTSNAEERRYVTGFFPDNESLLQAIQTELDDIVAAIFSGVRSITVEEDGNSYRFVVRTPSTGERFILVIAGSFMDGMSGLRPLDEGGNEVLSFAADSNYVYPVREIDSPVTSHGLGFPRVWFPGVTTFQQIDRGILHVLSANFGQFNPGETNTQLYVHLDRELPTSDVTELETIFVTDAVNASRDQIFLDSISSSNSRVTIKGASVGAGPLIIDGNATITFTRGVSATEGLQAFRQHILEKSLAANFGDMPFITSRDWAALDVWDELADANIQRLRRYVFEEPINVWDLLKAEALLLSAFWRLDSDGKIALAPIEPPGTGTVGLREVDTTNTVSPYGPHGAWPRWEPGGDGIVNTVEVVLPSTEHNRLTPGEAASFEIRSVEAVGTRKSRGRGDATIELMSSTDPRYIRFDEVIRSIQAYLSLMSTDYQQVTVPVTFDLFDVKAGDYVLLSNPHVPNAQTGERGMTNVVALVVARDWPLDPADRAYGELTVLLFDTTHAAGYAPSFWFDTATDVGGGIYQFSPGQASSGSMFGDHWPVGTDATDFFATGDQVVIRPLDAAGSVSIGTIDHLSANLLGVNVDVTSGVPPSEGIVDYITGDTPADVSDDQGAYAYVANDGGRLYSGERARKFS